LYQRLKKPVEQIARVAILFDQRRQLFVANQIAALAVLNIAAQLSQRATPEIAVTDVIGSDPTQPSAILADTLDAARRI
jgi:hypothetical protein